MAFGFRGFWDQLGFFGSELSNTTSRADSRFRLMVSDVPLAGVGFSFRGLVVYG